jgi:hypothetical protein
MTEPLEITLAASNPEKSKRPGKPQESGPSEVNPLCAQLPNTAWRLTLFPCDRNRGTNQVKFRGALHLRFAPSKSDHVPLAQDIVARFVQDNVAPNKQRSIYVDS